MLSQFLCLENSLFSVTRRPRPEVPQKVYQEWCPNLVLLHYHDLPFPQFLVHRERLRAGHHMVIHSLRPAKLLTDPFQVFQPH